MTAPSPNRLLVLSGFAGLLAAVMIERWISGWGLVTIHVQNAPVGKVVASIARQAHVRVESSLNPAKLVSMDVDKAPLTEALETLAIRTDASWRAAFLMAPGKSDLEAAILQLRESGKIEGWNTAYYPERGTGIPETQAFNPLSLEWKAEGPGLELSNLLDEAAQKTGAMTSLPKEWNPIAPRLPGTAAVGTAIANLAGSVRGKVAAIYLLAERTRRPDEPGVPPAGETLPDAAPRATPRPEWIAQRQDAQIKKLPAAKRVEAKRELDEARAFFASIKDLPQAERRARIQERMRDPAQADKMEEQWLLRNSKMTAGQRIQRGVNYLNRKAALKASTP